MRDNCDLVMRWTWDPVKNLTGITNTGIREAHLTPRVRIHRPRIELNCFCLFPEKTVETRHKNPREKKKKKGVCVNCQFDRLSIVSWEISLWEFLGGVISMTLIHMGRTILIIMVPLPGRVSSMGKHDKGN